MGATILDYASYLFLGMELMLLFFALEAVENYIKKDLLFSPQSGDENDKRNPQNTTQQE